eukprot:TRINITY_DN21525_c0_g5_i1.p1 TRINITY_DN21525_c0_g5~~TRINITY_DN21525_c0_g5_i1.p1  ORF type:complete len:1036 (-),score=236.09 TRINITY_DN21525_c0_g5_i1:149-3256(-)
MATFSSEIFAYSSVTKSTGDSSSLMAWDSFLWSTLSEAIWFLAGFLIFRLAAHVNLLPSWVKVGFTSRLYPKKIQKAPAKSTSGSGKTPTRSHGCKVICAESAAGNNTAVINTWKNEARATTTLPTEALQAVVLAYAELHPDELGEEIANYLLKHPSITRPKTLHMLVECLNQAGKPDLSEKLVNAIDASKLQIIDQRTQEMQILGFACQGNIEKVDHLLAEAGQGANLGGLETAAIRGFLQGGHMKTALLRIKEMFTASAGAVPPKALTCVIQAACSASKESQLLEILQELQGIPLPSEAAAVAMDEALKREDASLARSIEAHVREQGTALTYNFYEPLMKLMSKCDESHALFLFKEMIEKGLFLSEGLCGLVLSRCGESRHLELADAVQSYLRVKKMTSLATYKTLMKVYATCDQLERACDLYEQITSDGIEPDEVMRGCLAKFAARCDRVDLLAKLSDKNQSGEVFNFVMLIRSAGRKGDVEEAFSIFKKFKSLKSASRDAAVFNCLLDVCVTSQAMDRAGEVLQEMKALGNVTLVTYNTLIKGHCLQGDFSRARQLLQEMQKKGFQPDTASFNHIMGSAVSADKFRVAWQVFEDLEFAGVKADVFTLSILMKLAKKCSNWRDAQRSLSVLDRSDVNVCQDEVLLNTALDACIHCKDHKRLAQILSDFEATDINPSVQNYGLVIKGYSCLWQINKCWSNWKDMTDRGIIPSDVTLSCMLDALVSASHVDEAVSLFKDWRSKVPPNTIIFSVLIKGYTAQGDAAKAMAIANEMKEFGIPMNLVAFSTLINVHAKAGAVEVMESLLQQMEEEGFQPNTITYSSVVKGYCLAGNMDKALKTFATMLSKGVKVDTVIYNTLLDGGVRNNRFELCDQLLSDMPGYGVQPSNFTLSIVIKMWGKRRCLDEAFKAAEKAIEEGRLHLDSQICNALISACFHNSNPQYALKAFEDMKTWSNCDGPDSSTYGVLVTGLCRSGKAAEALYYAEKATSLATGTRATGKPLSSEVLTQLKKVVQQKGLQMPTWLSFDRQRSARS